MDNTKIVIAVLIVAAVAGLTAYGSKKAGQEENIGGIEQALEDSYTLVEVAGHPDASSCWTAIDGSVYDLTPWIDQHPGGADNILRICGRDGTAAFAGQHGGAPRPEQMLAGFRIGSLAE